MNNQPSDSPVPVPSELLDWGKFVSKHQILDMAPEIPSYFKHLYAIRPQKDYQFQDIRDKINTALTSNIFSEWTISYNDNDAEWTAEYVDFNRNNDYGYAPYKLIVLVSLYWEHQTKKHVVQVRAIQRSGEIGIHITRPFEEYLETMFAADEDTAHETACDEGHNDVNRL